MTRQIDPLFTLQAMPMIAARLAARHIDPAPMLRAAGLAHASRDAELTAPLSRVCAFIDAVAGALEDDFLGLTLADDLDPAAFGFTVYAARVAPSVRVGLRTLSELAASINPIGVFALHETSPSAKLEFVVPGARRGLGRQLNEHTVGLVVRYANDALREGLPLERVWLPHRRDKAGRAALEARLGCPVEVGAERVGLAFSSELLDVRPHGADESLFRFLTQRARELLAATSSDEVITAAMRAIEPRIAERELGVAKVAKVLAMSPRSLQRRLLDAGTSYRDVLDHVRHRKFRDLRRAGCTLEAAAEALGFNDSRGLRRAIARWRET